MSYMQYFIPYGFTYIFLAASVIAVVTRHDIVALALLIAVFIAALLGESISLVGLLSLAVFSILTHWRFNILRESMYRRFPWTEPTMDLLVIAACLTFFIHVVWGFHNTKIIDAAVMSTGGVPFSMYLNLDKTAAAIILALSGRFFTSGTEFDAPIKRTGTADTVKIIGMMWGGCLITLIPVALVIGYIKFDPKIMPHFGIWALNNLVFVAFAEEVLFRGMIQGRLLAYSYYHRWHPAFAITISAILFGLLHFDGGVAYIALAGVAGLFYGTAYYKTGRLISSISVHFLLNLSHALFFTYPALMR
ncbi:membrane protease YdiL (CAAX protease family) [Ochrobactrum sp. 19YEA23]|uniref:CPBP family intramembrane glutamic endopeptidase n=1 Tax=Ochrobactrum sp. 19YEA23 TaxID=3039854 RepID=UPI00247973C6|nr:membrane protease YdiL (CAAX protease family) [Ochrobactrum sp. 19YEA23]